MGDLVVQEETHQVDTVLQEDAGELVEQIETVVVDIQDRKGTAHSKIVNGPVFFSAHCS